MQLHQHRIASPDVQLVHAHFAWDATVLLPTVMRTDKPFIVTCHGYDVSALPQSNGPRGVIFRRRLPALRNRVARFLAVSDFIAGRLSLLGIPDEQITISRIGIDLSSFQEPPPWRGRAGIAFVGRLVPKKGAGDLLRAVGLLPGQLRNTPVSVVGDGPMLEELRELSSNLRLNCTFHGHLDPARVRSVLYRSSLFCVPSRTASSGDAEGLGMVFLEASASGLPIASYRHGGVEEAVLNGDTGLLAKEGDIPGLSLAIRTLLENSGLAQQLGVQGEAFVRKEYDITTRTRALEAVYDDVSSRGRR
jgi:glycosyltransferase involved in cell wall biosynthesis